MWCLHWSLLLVIVRCCYLYFDSLSSLYIRVSVFLLFCNKLLCIHTFAVYVFHHIWLLPVWYLNPSPSSLCPFLDHTVLAEWALTAEWVSVPYSCDGQWRTRKIDTDNECTLGEPISRDYRQIKARLEERGVCEPHNPYRRREANSTCVLVVRNEQQQHSLFSQASWGRLEMKLERKNFKVQAHW
jgi:hypothetical protein